MVIVLGLWITIVPYLGVPSSWRTALLVLTGIVVVVVGFLLRVDSLSRGSRRAEHRPFVESMPRGHLESHDSPAAHHKNDHKEGISSLN